MDSSRLPWAVFLMGPTASGKTELAAQLVEHLPLDIISVDSALVYRGLNIGTAKPDAALLARAPHRLIDICAPTEAYSAARFRDDALAAMAEIVKAGRIPFLVGGTMLYFRALQGGLSTLPAADPGVRQQLQTALEQDGLHALHCRLAAVDPESAARIHQNDPQRILRALEVFELTGEPLSRLQTGGESVLPYQVVKMVRAPEREVLRQRAELRFDAMLTAGFREEVEGLLQLAGADPDLPAFRAVGYRQMVEHLGGQTDFGTMRERAINATRQLAKRQMTWLRSEPGVHWLREEPDSPESVLSQALTILRRIPMSGTSE